LADPSSISIAGNSSASASASTTAFVFVPRQQAALASGSGNEMTTSNDSNDHAPNPDMRSGAISAILVAESNVQEVMMDLEEPGSSKNQTSGPSSASGPTKRSKQSKSHVAEKRQRGRPVSKLSSWEGQYYRHDSAKGCYVPFPVAAGGDLNKFKISALKKAPVCDPSK